MTSLEQMIEAAKHLPPQDRRSLQQWLERQEQLDVEEQQKAARLQQELEQYQRAKQWIAEHRAEYLGHWVALEGEQLISHSLDAKQVYAAAKAAGIRRPFIVQIIEEPTHFLGGFELCR
jgi:Family of unknown function (DUF5678)